MSPENAPPTTAATPPHGADAEDLHALSGLPVFLDADALALRFGPEVHVAMTDRRTAADLRPVLSPETRVAASDETIYTVHRGVAPDAATAEEIDRRGLIYVALVMRAGPVGEERARTRGHVNAPAPGTSLPVPEVHEVWHGRALLYLQSSAAPDVDDVIALEMGAGDKAVVPPGWASLIANVGEGPLAVGSWRVRDCTPRYDELESLGGMAHFVLAAPPPQGAQAPLQGAQAPLRSFHFEPNTRYRSVPIPRRAAPRDQPDLGLIRGEPMLTAFRSNPEFFRFLLRPQDYDPVWTTLYP